MDELYLYVFRVIQFIRIVIVVLFLSLSSFPETDYDRTQGTLSARYLLIWFGTLNIIPHIFLCLFFLMIFIHVFELRCIDSLNV
ncbi:hypothetical protein BCV72DRAFT_113979 [Rhizopus microsporus var. microsporus]|uniref:Uncharacterized protein n=1 Tax=Rhizopus microsporus var. microsporus TaxID=86635 RepID=A0A1X0R4T8_RHIZD|nr:hypothetical protein BCV72DRAFT_113979 [Rhizopus microsporus var. microsporus]